MPVATITTDGATAAAIAADADRAYLVLQNITDAEIHLRAGREVTTGTDATKGIVLKRNGTHIYQGPLATLPIYAAVASGTAELRWDDANQALYDTVS